jgi:hypothetical protein
MRRIGHQIARRVEDRAGKVEPFLDVDRPRCVGQRRAHLVGHVAKEVRHDLEHHRVGLGVGGEGAPCLFPSAQG